jgi:hypothetical protein
MWDLLIDLLIIGFASTLAIVVANAVMKYKNVRKAEYRAILIITMLGVVFVLGKYLKPAIDKWRLVYTLQNEVVKYEPFATLSTTFPEEYEQLKGTLSKSIGDGEDRSQVYRKMIPMFMGIVKSKFAMASDGALVNFSTAFLATVKYLYTNGKPEVAFEVMYNQVDMPHDWHDAIPQELKNAEFAAYKEIFNSAVRKQIPPINDKKASDLLKVILADLYKDYGDDVVLLQRPLEQREKKTVIVKLMITLYERILALPQSDQATVIRYLFTKLPAS